jgi:hypothetical protein
MTSLQPKTSRPLDPARQDRSSEIDPLRAQHLALAARMAMGPDGLTKVLVDDGESPLMWLARRKGKDGHALIAPHHLLAGERLRCDFTCAQLMPRTTSNWDLSISRERRSGSPAMTFTETSIAARQRVHHALDAVGPEFSGLLLDVCCFLKGLEDVERERLWPRSSARVVLQLGLERLARHYGYGAEAVGKAGAKIRRWSVQDGDG